MHTPRTTPSPAPALLRRIARVGSALALTAPGFLAAPGPEESWPDESWIEVPFASERWSRTGVAARTVEHLGRPALRLEDGLLWLPDAAFLHGEVRFDIAFSGERGFVGAAFRIQDPLELEHFYLRPHQSGQPDSCQYTPVFHGSSAWQLLPEAAATIEYAFDRWTRVRLVVWEDVLQVFVDSEEPQLVTRLCRDPRAGGLGIRVPGNFAPAHFSDFRYRHLGSRPPGAVLAATASPAHTVPVWEVSDGFAEARLQRPDLPKSLLGELRWSALETEPNGVLNLARLQGVSPAADTCFARLELHAARPAIVAIDFGFSDRVKVYQERALIFEGDDGYRSRDHRFLGTIGRYDRLTLRLRAGRNEVLFAVSESFGGWGLTASIDPVSGVTLR